MIVVILILIFVAGLCNGLMDRISFHFDTMPKYFQERSLFWNPSLSWRNKWKNGNKSKGERFLGSSTVFVGFTDAWHLLKMIMKHSLFLGIGLSLNIIKINIIGCINMNTVLNIVFLYLLVFSIFQLGFKITYK